MANPEAKNTNTRWMLMELTKDSVDFGLIQRFLYFSKSSFAGAVEYPQPDNLLQFDIVLQNPTSNHPPEKARLLEFAIYLYSRLDDKAIFAVTKELFLPVLIDMIEHVRVLYNDRPQEKKQILDSALPVAVTLAQAPSILSRSNPCPYLPIVTKIISCLSSNSPELTYVSENTCQMRLSHEEQASARESHNHRDGHTEWNVKSTIEYTITKTHIINTPLYAALANQNERHLNVLLFNHMLAVKGNFEYKTSRGYCHTHDIKDMANLFSTTVNAGIGKDFGSRACTKKQVILDLIAAQTAYNNDSIPEYVEHVTKAFQKAPRFVLQYITYHVNPFIEAAQRCVDNKSPIEYLPVTAPFLKTLLRDCALNSLYVPNLSMFDEETSQELNQKIIENILPLLQQATVYNEHSLFINEREHNNFLEQPTHLKLMSLMPATESEASSSISSSPIKPSIFSLEDNLQNLSANRAPALTSSSSSTAAAVIVQDGELVKELEQGVTTDNSFAIINIIDKATGLQREGRATKENGIFFTVWDGSQYNPLLQKIFTNPCLSLDAIQKIINFIGEFEPNPQRILQQALFWVILARFQEENEKNRLNLFIIAERLMSHISIFSNEVFPEMNDPNFELDVFQQFDKRLQQAYNILFFTTQSLIWTTLFSNKSCLYLAVLCSMTDVAKLLLINGADPKSLGGLKDKSTLISKKHYELERISTAKTALQSKDIATFKREVTTLLIAAPYMMLLYLTTQLKKIASAARDPYMRQYDVDSQLAPFLRVLVIEFFRFCLSEHAYFNDSSSERDTAVQAALLEAAINNIVYPILGEMHVGKKSLFATEVEKMQLLGNADLLLFSKDKTLARTDFFAPKKRKAVSVSISSADSSDQFRPS